MTTTIGRCEVIVKHQRKCSVYRFTGGARRGDAGIYAFWTAVYKRRTAAGRSKVTGRALVGLSAGDRFNRIARDSVSDIISAEDRAEYARLWIQMQQGQNVRFVRPATQYERDKWMASHLKDARFATEMVTA